MLTFIFTIFMFLIFGKILVFAVKAAWGISKIIASVVLLPLFLSLKTNKRRMKNVSD